MRQHSDDSTGCGKSRMPHVNAVQLAFTPRGVHDLNAPKTAETDIMEHLLQAGAPVDAVDGCTPTIIAAIEANDCHSAVLMLQAGARIDGIHVMGAVAEHVQDDVTAATMAIVLHRCGGSTHDGLHAILSHARLSMLRVLLAHALDPNDSISLRYYHTASRLLHVAARFGPTIARSTDMLICLLRAGAEVDFTVIERMQYAGAQAKHVPFIKWLWNHPHQAAVVAAHARRDDDTMMATIATGDVYDILRVEGTFGSALGPHCDLLRMGLLLHWLRTACQSIRNTTWMTRHGHQQALLLRFAQSVAAWALPRRRHALTLRWRLLQPVYSALRAAAARTAH